MNTKKDQEKKSLFEKEVIQVLRVDGVLTPDHSGVSYVCRTTLQDTSEKDMALFANAPKNTFVPGEWVKVQFKVPEPFEVSARVLWAHPVPRNSHIIKEKQFPSRVGLEFPDLSKEEKGHLENFVAYLKDPFFRTKEEDDSENLIVDSGEGSEKEESTAASEELPEESFSEDAIVEESSAEATPEDASTEEVESSEPEKEAA